MRYREKRGVAAGSGRGFTIEQLNGLKAVLACRTCAERWVVEDPGEGHLLPAGWWICPNGCNDPDVARRPAAEPDLSQEEPRAAACEGAACNLSEESRLQFARSQSVPGAAVVVYAGATFADLEDVAGWWGEGTPAES